jgi:hypothetical protein
MPIPKLSIYINDPLWIFKEVKPGMLPRLRRKEHQTDMKESSGVVGPVEG